MVRDFAIIHCMWRFRWLIMENPSIKWMIWGYPYDLGNLHVTEVVYWPWPPWKPWSVSLGVILADRGCTASEETGGDWTEGGDTTFCPKKAMEKGGKTGKCCWLEHVVWIFSGVIDTIIGIYKKTSQWEYKSMRQGGMICDSAISRGTEWWRTGISWLGIKAAILWV